MANYITDHLTDVSERVQLSESAISHLTKGAVVHKIFKIDQKEIAQEELNNLRKVLAMNNHLETQSCG